jgi:hypothetical protein
VSQFAAEEALRLKRELVVHALKVTKRTVRVKKYLSMVFIERTVSLKQPFQDLLKAKLARAVRQHGRFRIISRARYNDWMVIFPTNYPEKELDQMLIDVANQLGVMLFIEPGIPLAEMMTDPKSFDYTINLNRRRPSN